ncbi:MAG TPA: hypothetical protein VJN95_03240 [Gemmatimonadales bacterium]|nr:hypothetical protein [Gemmatimonadales bacterium]
MPVPALTTSAGLISLLLAGAGPGAPPTIEVPASPDAWSASDSLRPVNYLGHQALWINRGVALVRGAAMTNGRLELDVAASDTTNFLGIVFRAANPRFSNVIFLRPGASGTEEAIQYGPAFNTVGVAWQVYHGHDANAVVDLSRNRWIHLRLDLDGAVARFYVDTATQPTLTVPWVVESGGTGIGIWAGAFGKGAYFSNVRYTPAAEDGAPPPPSTAPAGTITRWSLSNAIEAAEFHPAVLPDLGKFQWQTVQTEPEGWLLINRYREAPVGGVPYDSTGAVLVDSVMSGKVARSRIVYARATITSDKPVLRRLRYSYNNGVVIYLNGRPLAFAMNPGGLRTNLGVMARVGDAVYLPLNKGKNELVFAVIDMTGGWACSARLDPPEGGH